MGLEDHPAVARDREARKARGGNPDVESAQGFGTQDVPTGSDSQGNALQPKSQRQQAMDSIAAKVAGLKLRGRP